MQYILWKSVLKIDLQMEQSMQIRISYNSSCTKLGIN